MGLVSLPPGQSGSAKFNDDRTRRYVLRRWWGNATEDSPFALWVCMNPSIAGDQSNDPSITRMVGFTKRLQKWEALAVANAYDLIATDPKQLMAPRASPCSDTNLGTILDLAAQADVIILGYGHMPPRLRSLPRHMVHLLRERGHAEKLYCLGTTIAKDPCHPLYLAGHTPFIPYTVTPDA